MPTDNNTSQLMAKFEIPDNATKLTVNKYNDAMFIDWLSGDSIVESRQISAFGVLWSNQHQKDTQYLTWLFGLVREWDYAENPTEERRVWKVDRND